MATARTPIPTEVLVRNGSVVKSAGTPGALTMTIPSTGKTSAGAFRTFLEIKNGGGSAVTATVHAGGNGVDASGNAQTGLSPFSGVGGTDISVSVAAGATAYVGPFDTARAEQADGSLSLDLSGTTSVTVWAIQEPVAR